MKMKNFILHYDILTVQVNINNGDYTFGIRWKAPKKPYDDTWELQSYCNNITGEKDLTEEQIKTFMDTINPRVNWNMADFK